MSMMERMMSLMMERMSKEDKESMMDSMMEKFFADITPNEKSKMMAEMMPRMMEGMDMKSMMPTMMKGMMSGGAGGKPCQCMEKMEKMETNADGGMPGMMLEMMPHCLEMMLPSLSPDKRGAAAAGILSAIVDKGATDLSDEQRRSFFAELERILESSAT